jgi:hypothetical protein
MHHPPWLMSQPTVEMPTPESPARSSQSTDRGDNGGYPMCPSLGLLAPLGCAGYSLSDVPLGLYHVATRSDLTKVCNDVFDKIQKESVHSLTMRTGFVFGRANASVSAVSPPNWPANGFLEAALRGTFHALRN